MSICLSRISIRSATPDMYRGIRGICVSVLQIVRSATPTIKRNTNGCCVSVLQIVRSATLQVPALFKLWGVSVLQIVRSATPRFPVIFAAPSVSVLQIVRSATLMIVYFTYSVNYVTYNSVKSVTSQYFSLNSTKVFPIPVNSGSYGSLQIKYLSPYNDVISSIPPILSTILSYLVIHN